MSAITITLSDDQLSKLKETAARLGIAPEELVSASIVELLNRGNETSESELLQSIRQGLPPDLERQFAKLNDKRWKETLTPEEQTELIRLTDTIEELQVQRIKNLVELARLRKTSLTALMDSLGIRPRA